MKLTDEQARAAKALQKFREDDERIFRFSGYAGTGKTTLLSYVLGPGDPNVFFAAPTAKAAQVLTSKGLPARTLHSLLYTPYETIDPKTKKPKLGFKLNPKSDLARGGVVVVDESSMVPSWMADDLMEFPVKVIAVGDPAQLPPVMSKGNQSLLSGKPDVVLENVQRSALDSPVTALATIIRRDGKITGYGTKGSSGVYRSIHEVPRPVSSFDQVIVGTHRTRFKLTRRMRPSLPDLPVEGDRVICKSNNKEIGAVNGDQYMVRKAHGMISEDAIGLELEPVEGGPRIYADVWKYGFTGPEGREYLSTLPMKDRNAYLEMWMANAITAHSSQGSEWNHVLVVNEAHVFKPNDDKWLYTAVTRARESVTVVRSI